MRKLSIFARKIALAGVAATVSLSVLAAGGLHMGAQRASSSATLTVTIPGIVALDVEGDLLFDVNGSTMERTSQQPQGEGLRDVFPPPPGYHGPIVFDAARSETPSTLAASPAPASGSLMIFIFCNKEEGALQIQAAVAPTWNPSPGPGFATSAIRVMASPSNNPYNVGGSQPVHLTSTLSPLNPGALPNRFTWTRMDLHFDIEVPDASSVIFRPGTYSTVITLTATKS
jgi:hypothetical protein